jgi:hypothetical protein
MGSVSFRNLVTATKVLLVSAVLTSVSLISLQLPVHAQDVSISSAQNCDGNAVIFCGASSVTQLQNRYRNGDGHNSAASIQAIYNHFDISSTDISAMSTSSVTVESGNVTSDGNVLGDKNNNLLATGAMTAGRQDIAGSTRHQSGSTVFYTRPPSVSFQSHTLSAYVVIMNGKFAFAILASCGNPVVATAKSTPTPAPTPQPKPQPTPPQPTPAPAPVVQPTTVSICSGNITGSTVTTTASNNSAAGVAQGNCNTNIVNNTIITTPGTPTCDELGLTQSGTDTATINSFMTTANGGTFTSADVNWGDGTSSMGIANPIGLQHTFASDGTFMVSVAAHFTVNGQDVVASGGVCQQQVSFNTPTPTVPPAVTPTPPANTSNTPVTPAPAQTLVNTGPGDVIGIFAVTTVASTLGYRVLLMRRLRA